MYIKGDSSLSSPLDAFSKCEDIRKWFTIPMGIVRSSPGSSTSRSAFGKIFEANHPHHGRQVSTSSPGITF